MIDMLKGHRSQFEGANIGQIRNNLRIAINDAGTDNPNNKIRNHKFILLYMYINKNK